MDRQSILHIPMSEYAHGRSEERVVIRLRAKKDDLKKVTLFVGDTACRKNPIDFFPFEMEVVASDLYFDYFEADFVSPFKRMHYYFLLDDGKETINYFSGFFRNDLPDGRSEYYKLPFNHRADIADIPDWVHDAVIYNIFPDSFATKKGFITGAGTETTYKNDKMTEAVKTKGRLGGTIKGISENVDYLKDLGINCIYINPLFAAGEYHKYDTIDYFSVDPNFGTNEDFREMVKTLHANGIRVITDGVFNHCGWNFFAFDDVIRNQEKSKYVDWFYGLEFPVERPDDPDAYPTYDCFAYERLMPKLNTQNPEVIDYIYSVAEYWIKEFDTDGWRLDVADEVNDDLWRGFRKRVKSIKPDAFIIGEVWVNASHWMQGDMYDSVMNYDLRKYCRYYFAEGGIDTETFSAGVTDLYLRYKKNMTFGTLNLLDSHDVPRFFTSCNGDERKFMEAVVFQMMFVGAPSVFYGDEQGFTGVTEAEYRRPMEFSEGKFYDFYKNIISIRRNEKAVRRGSYKRILGIGAGVFAFRREYEGEYVDVYLNNSEMTERVNAGNGTVLFENGYDRENKQLRGFSYLIVKGNN